MISKIKELFKWRELIFSLALKDLKIKYRQATGGFGWMLAMPLVQVAIFTFIFRFLFKIKIENYPLFLLAGLFPWSFLRSSLDGAMNSILNNANLIKKIYFPREILSISNIIGQFNLSEIKMNETEIDRLYHLIAKIVSLSLIDSNILHSSNIKNVSFIPSYFLIGKRLENIADNINNLSEYLYDKKISFKHMEILQIIRAELNRTMAYFMRIPGSFDIFNKMDEQNLHQMRILLSTIKDTAIRNYIGDIARFTLDVQEEMINISFYNQLIQNKIL